MSMFDYCREEQERCIIQGSTRDFFLSFFPSIVQ